MRSVFFFERTSPLAINILLPTEIDLLMIRKGVPLRTEKISDKSLISIEKVLARGQEHGKSY